MTRSIQPTIHVITGPTASGKSRVALSIAESLKKKNINSAIINADSQQMYRELRILTARPSPEEEGRAPHRLYGVLSAAESCSAGKWLQLARMEIDWARAQGMTPLVVGGTGLYLRGLLEGLAAIPDIDPAVRLQARQDFDAMGRDAFHDRLKQVDPQLGEQLRVSDTQRLLRAYEVWLGTGKPLSWWRRQGVQPPYPQQDFRIYQVDISRDMLYRRCNERFLAMLEAGAVDEVRQLLELGLSPALPAMKSVGVKELAAYLKGEMTLEAAIANAQQATRHYAKRQLTWFRHQLSGHPRLCRLSLEKIEELLTHR